MFKNLLYRIKDKFTHTGSKLDKLAPTTSAATNFAHLHINEEPKKYIDTHHFSYEYCLAHSGESINERFRENRPDHVDLQVSKMVSSNSTNTDLVLYRGVCTHVYDLMVENARNIPGCDFYEKGFLATSLVKGHEINYDIKLRIHVPAGTKCVFMGNVNDEPEYYEVDVMRGAKLKIISMDDEYINCELLETE